MASLVLSGDTSGTVTLAAPTVAGTQSYTLPTAVPAANGYALTSTTGGVMSWAATGAAATPTALGTVYGSTNAAQRTAVGYQALNAATGTYNTAFGYQAGITTTGDQNAYFGWVSGFSNTTGASNTAFGNASLYTNSTGSFNTAVGQGALQSNTASNNTAVGYQAGNAVTAAGNTLIGANAGNDTVVLTTGTNNVIVGGYARTSSAGATNQIVLGYNFTGQADSNVTIGSSAGKIYNAFTVNATWTQTSDGRLKTNINDDSLGLSFINRLRPVTFNWKASPDIDPSLPYYKETNERDTTTVIHGLIAQEVKAALDAEGCSTFNGWDAGNDDTIQAISREMFISPLIKAMQELSTALDAANARIAALEAK